MRFLRIRLASGSVFDVRGKDLSLTIHDVDGKSFQPLQQVNDLEVGERKMDDGQWEFYISKLSAVGTT
jgi:hypothetical protein